jgi:uncharacterized protein YbaP (TraB family)
VARRTAFAALATLALLVPRVFAQSAAPPPAPVQDWSIETVVVTAKRPGPALWHVTKGNSEVWILGVLGPVPKDLKWNTGAFETALSGAKAVLLPPHGQVGPFEGLWFLIWHGDMLRLPDGESLETVLPPSLKSRFVTARSAIHKDADDYAEYKPSIAGFLLERDFLKANDLTGAQPQDAIRNLADRHIVPARAIASYEALDVVKEIPSLSEKANLACLTDSLDDIDVMAKHARLAAEAWANGDLDGIKANYSEPRALDCLSQSASFNKLFQRSVSDTMAALDAALSRPGKTVAVINIGELLRQNGIVDKLKAEGLTVEGPGG